MAGRHIVSVFDRFQRERTMFASALLDYSKQEQNVDALVACGGVQLLRQLAEDPTPSIQYAATLTLGRLASHSHAIAGALVKQGFHAVLVAKLQRGAGQEAPGSVAGPEQHVRLAACKALRGLTRHDAGLAGQAAAAEVAAAAVACLTEGQDPDMQEAACWVLGNTAGHSAELATLVAEARALPAVVGCVGSAELAVKCIAASVLATIADHSAELAQRVADADAVAQLTAALQSPLGSDVKLRRQACCALGRIAKASPELAMQIMRSGAGAEIVRCLGAKDALVKQQAAVALREVAKQKEAAAEAVADSGCVPLLVAAASQPGEQMLHAITVLGFLSAYSEGLAAQVEAAGAAAALVPLLSTSGLQDYVACAAVWALGNLGRHSAQLANAVADAGAIPAMAKLEAAGGSSEDLKSKSTKALAGILGQLSDIACLQLLVQRKLPAAHLEAVMKQVAAALAADPAARAGFVQSGALKAVQELGEAPRSPFKELMQRITAQFPEEIVNYYSPSYSKQLLSKLNKPVAASVHVTAGAGWEPALPAVAEAAAPEAAPDAKPASPPAEAVEAAPAAESAALAAVPEVAAAGDDQ